MTERATLSPVEAAKAVGVTTFELDEYLRGQAAARLESIAMDIRRGHESARGDVERDEYDDITEGVWRVVEAAKALTAHWTQALQDDDV